MKFLQECGEKIDRESVGRETPTMKRRLGSADRESADSGQSGPLGPRPAHSPEKQKRGPQEGRAVIYLLDILFHT